MLEHEGRSQLLIWNCMKSINIFGNIIKARNTHSVCKWLNFYEVKLSWKFIHNPWPSTCGVNWNKLFAIVLIFPLSFCKKGQIWESVQFGQDWLMEGRHGRTDMKRDGSVICPSLCAEWVSHARFKKENNFHHRLEWKEYILSALHSRLFVFVIRNIVIWIAIFMKFSVVL